ncbi:unnamed protein product, partial [Prorocentrum cordatum]
MSTPVPGFVRAFEWTTTLGWPIEWASILDKRVRPNSPLGVYPRASQFLPRGQTPQVELGNLKCMKGKARKRATTALPPGPEKSAPHRDKEEEEEGEEEEEEEEEEEAEEGEEEEPPRPTGALAEQGKRPPPPARCRFAECTRSRSCAHCRLWLAPAKSPNEVHQGAGVPKLGLDVREGRPRREV